MMSSTDTTGYPPLPGQRSITRRGTRNNDAGEIDLLRRTVSCALILEREGWHVDPAESSRRAVKYRRGSGEILIITHDDKGWWNPLGEEKGDCFSLIQFLHPDRNFGHVRQTLRAIAGIAPSGPVAVAGSTPDRIEAISPLIRWQAKPALRPTTKAWGYLARDRHLPATILAAAAAQDCIRAGGFGCAWFAHRDHEGRLTGIEARGPGYRGVLRGGQKSLFRFTPGGTTGYPRRVAVTEAPIDALSLAALEPSRTDTIYVATTGGLGPGTVTALSQLVGELGSAGGTLVIATDADAAGDHHAARIEATIASIAVTIERSRPPGAAKDWNEALTRASAC
ncbi:MULTISPECIES: DUF3991 and TOPRIM domain-containing protein [Acidiphilium]|uniref:Toprim-like n=1 Tax=Acidiphilium rubrum TaxID=526 RepID=A0A8G2FFK2_ACIRU|nr:MULTISPECIES: DUF3991 and TOPRIM domain-containing protein [Acidiphilium]SIR47014.1 Toprim-like [Acidiphilium rubrum]